MDTTKPTTGPAGNKNSSRKPKREVVPPKKKLMPYREPPKSRESRPMRPGVPGPVPVPGQPKPNIDDQIYRTMPITEPQLKQIKKAYGIK
jgi:hypothetical protein